MLFKVLTSDGTPAHGGSGAYPLPKGGRPGRWTEAVEPKACVSGYHLTTRPGKWWVDGARLFVAERRGAVHCSGNKVACASVRLVEEITPGWDLLGLFHEVRALLVSSWRKSAGPDAQWPDWADLRGAYLRGADLGGADLSGADLSGADLRGAYLRGAYHPARLPSTYAVDASGFVVAAQ